MTNSINLKLECKYVCKDKWNDTIIKLGNDNLSINLEFCIPEEAEMFIPGKEYQVNISSASQEQS